MAKSTKKQKRLSRLNQPRPKSMCPQKLNYIERSPEAVLPLTEKTIRVLQNMLNHRLGMAAIDGSVSQFRMTEIATLSVAIAELSEVLKNREEAEHIPDSNDFNVDDQVRILVGGPHENLGRIATVGRIQEDGDVVIYFDDQDEDEWVYSPNELEKVASRPVCVEAWEGKPA